MSKVFRLYRGGSDTYEGWNESPSFPYNTTNRETIEDPDGASSKHEITSIPSPFARIDLVKIAFRQLTQHNNESELEGKTIFHKMVSDTLDIAEIFFNLDKYKDKIEVIVWDRSVMLDELEQSDCEGHRYLADSLRKYLRSDAATYNFADLKNLYLLNYKAGPDELNIIGSTSPATLFFSNANDLSYINDIYFGEDRPFDDEYQPLYKRDFQFVKYLFALRASINNFSKLFPEVDSYLTLTYRSIKKQSQKDELNSINQSYFEQLSPISVTQYQHSDFVEVLGNTMYQKLSSRTSVAHSDFAIKSYIYSGDKPLVLPIEAGNKYRELVYTTGKWGETNKAPYFDEEEDISKRRLPFDGSVMPYLTISDFLEDWVIAVPHKLNKSDYFDGNIKNLDDKQLSYLLPLKTTIFEYFSIDDLTGRMEDNKPMFEMDKLTNNSVKVYLRIPISGNNKVGYVEYTRTYYSNNKPNIEKNEGGVRELDFTGFIMPLVRFVDPKEAMYNVSCINESDKDFEINCYAGRKKISPNEDACRVEGKEHKYKARTILIEGQNIDYLTVADREKKSGLLIPKFRKQKGIETFEFAIDLGTSNTHIEYRKSGTNTSEVFKIAESDSQISEFFMRWKDDSGAEHDLADETELMEKDFLPKIIGEGDFIFPTRTVLSCAKTTDWRRNVYPYELANIPFTYDKRRPLPYNKFLYNIKWGKGEESSVIETYVHCLMLIIRNKVLLNNGDLSRTKITWFYPISMLPKRLEKLEKTWNVAYKKYFGEGATVKMTESSAPIQYFFRRYSTATNLVNIDMGGGTTDIAFARDKQVEYVTSFKFATNALFENSFADQDETNGIIDYHKGGIRKILEKNSLNELVAIFDSESNSIPSNMASFLFGLKNNTQVEEKKISSSIIDFNTILNEDDNFKIVFILYYSSIIYHIAKITKVLGLEVPRHISFSGNGSKVIRILTADPERLAQYTKLLYEGVLGKSYGKELNILGLEEGSNPKESTCKGGLLGVADSNSGIKDIIFKSDSSGIATQEDTYDTVDSGYKEKVVSSVTEFFDYVLGTMNEQFNFDDNFGVTSESLRIAREVCQKDLGTFLDKGIAQNWDKNKTEDKVKIGETFFFYPIKGVLDQISSEIFKSLNEK